MSRVEIYLEMRNIASSRMSAIALCSQPQIIWNWVSGSEQRGQGRGSGKGCGVPWIALVP